MKNTTSQNEFTQEIDSSKAYYQHHQCPIMRAKTNISFFNCFVDQLKPVPLSLWPAQIFIDNILELLSTNNTDHAASMEVDELIRCYGELLIRLTGQKNGNCKYTDKMRGIVTVSISVTLLNHIPATMHELFVDEKLVLKTHDFTIN